MGTFSAHSSCILHDLRNGVVDNIWGFIFNLAFTFQIHINYLLMNRKHNKFSQSNPKCTFQDFQPHS